MIGETGVLLWQPTGHGGLNGAEAKASVWGKYFSHEFVVNSIE